MLGAEPGQLRDQQVKMEFRGTPRDHQFQAQSWPGTACLSCPAVPPTPQLKAPASTRHWAHCWRWLIVFQNKVLDVDGMKVKLQVRQLGKGELRAPGRDGVALTTGLYLSL